MEEVHRARAQGLHALQMHHCPHIATAAVPNLLAPGSSFTEDTSSMDGRLGVVSG